MVPYMAHLNHTEKAEVKNVNAEILNGKTLWFIIRFHTKYNNLIKNNNRYRHPWQ